VTRRNVHGVRYRDRRLGCQVTRWFADERRALVLLEVVRAEHDEGALLVTVGRARGRNVTITVREEKGG